MSVEPYPLLDTNAPIAVLIGYGTASSGEIVAIAFTGKENIRSFGRKSHGLTTGNSSYTLSEGPILVLTTTYYANREGKHYSGKIMPDYVVSSNHADSAITDDETVSGS